MKGPIADLLKREQFSTGNKILVQAETDGTAKSITLGDVPSAKKKKKKNK